MGDSETALTLRDAPLRALLRVKFVCQVAPPPFTWIIWPLM
jgi:hypothetical protein